MLITLIIVLLIVGAALYLIRLIPIDNTIKTIIQVIIIVAVAIYVLKTFAAPMMQ